MKWCLKLKIRGEVSVSIESRIYEPMTPQGNVSLANSIAARISGLTFIKF